MASQTLEPSRERPQDGPDVAASMPRLIEAACATVIDHAEELTRLDQAIGDGDHGSNMERGFAAIRGQAGELAALDLGAALVKAGMTLVTTVGGASGPLYGSLLMAMGKAAQAGKPPLDWLGDGIDAVKRRGKSDIGAKTLLDVLVPVRDAWQAQDGAPLGQTIAAVRAAAAQGHEATRDMLATRGRASFLGERSRGHLDPGATSSRLLIEAVCAVLEGRAEGVA